MRFRCLENGVESEEEVSQEKWFWSDDLVEDSCGRGRVMEQLVSPELDHCSKFDSTFGLISMSAP